MSDPQSNTSETSSFADLSGQQLGNLRLLRRLGRGAMAEVYLAEEIGLNRRVAVKGLKPELACDQTYLRRFEREAQAAASLVHANIVQIHQVGHVNGLHYIVQEYVQGQNLQEFVSRNGPLDLPQSLSVMRQVAAALAKAAEQGVVHRDIKPDNIMITQSSEVKVADFGLARLAGDGDGVELTRVGITMGTPLYMSPEQVEGRTLDHRSDIYSFGVTCYYMLTGETPFVGDTALAVAVQHLKKEPRPLDSLRPDLPPALCRIVEKMLAKNPDDRWPTARDLLCQLRRVFVEHCSEADTDDLGDWEPETSGVLADPRLQTMRHLGGLMKNTAMPRVGRQARWLLAAGLLVAVVAGGIGGWFTFRKPPILPVQGPKLTPVPRQENALQQWFYASRVPTEEAWRSVIDYFPEKEHMVHRAEQQLARIYLHRGDYDQAMELFDKFAKLGDKGDKEFKAFGLAGKCGVLSIQKQYSESAKAYYEFSSFEKDLRDPQMKILVEDARKRNLQNLDPQTFEDLFDLEG
jgi:eukaryotic-like serine/threonine-protein kinase